MHFQSSFGQILKIQNLWRWSHFKSKAQQRGFGLLIHIGELVLSGLVLWSFDIFGCRAINEIGIHWIAFYVDVSNNTAKLILKPKSTLVPLMMMLLTRPAACPISVLDARGPRCLAASTATHYQFSDDNLKTGSRPIYESTWVLKDCTKERVRQMIL